MALLEIQNLSVDFEGDRQTLRAVDGIDLSVEEGEVIGVVGESGSGKSVTMLAAMGLIAFPGVISAHRLEFGGNDLLSISSGQRRKITGKDMAMVFQEPMSSLNPCFSVGFQIMETLKVHEGGTKKQRRARTIELLHSVGIPNPGNRMHAYPHQLSGGMNQRVMIAMAISCNPKLLIADEPTTALDVTIQKQILDLLLGLQRERNMALILITHNMGVVAETVERVVVMYAGQVVEQQPKEALFASPNHPYTAALLEALPERGIGRSRLPTIPGVVPGIYDRPRGCLFNPRCRMADAKCAREGSPLHVRENSSVRCHYPLGAGSGAA